ncbi:TetR family transcriptional regulator [Actinoplanes cyaneus]|uniref:TetR family transcriptional regulator n=1 Tax=Actinoplanes cyaneus TaxID=52696 RepID=A0A919IG79_9ACTN|nr:TetR family transcriptional regulator [Actinoplanes cyaneus]MCW2142067.1 transcriptional regulator, TetR family [Actinoplanes cyaneus]GID63776.1 TetR family transcriptional regulator [Actinoplanes cyaneus]
MSSDLDFRRARSPEQREARRRVILGVAADLLGEMPLSEISLRELARRVGLSKTNVVRYFETREAVFFALLLQSMSDWLDDLPAELDAERVPESLAESLGRRPLICELWSALGSELERNISAAAALEFKLAHGALQGRLAALLTERLTGFGEAAAREFVAMTILLVAGLWPFANPAPSVAEALLDARLAPSRVDFPVRLGRALRIVLDGLPATGAESLSP